MVSQRDAFATTPTTRGREDDQVEAQLPIIHCIAPGPNYTPRRNHIPDYRDADLDELDSLLPDHSSQVIDENGISVRTPFASHDEDSQ